MRIGYSRQLNATHVPTSEGCPPTQSRHFARVICGQLSGCPRSRKSETGKFRGSIPTKWPLSAGYGEGSRKRALRPPPVLLWGGVLSQATAGALESIAKTSYYKVRSWKRLLEKGQMQGLSSRELEALERWLPDGRVDLKRADGLAMIDAMSAFLAGDSPPHRADFEFVWTDLWDKFTRSHEHRPEI